MLKEIRLQNFRCFHDHLIPLRSRSVVIGRNNAGKSTVVEALRLVSVVTDRYQSLTFREPPAWTGLPRREVGVSPARDQFDFGSDNVFHRYGDPPAIVTATFLNGASLRTMIGPGGELHATLTAQDRTPIRNRAQTREQPFPKVAVMPQVGPISRDEKVLTAEHVRRNLNSSLASLHFRNQLLLLPDYFARFASLTESTWPALQVRQVEQPEELEPIRFMVRDGDFVSELGTMGHGLQMWLQTMWFLSRVDRGSTVILDEPDVYMHPDLQRRLIRHVQSAFNQTIVTTHSVEIISEVLPEDILIVDRTLPASRFAVSLPSVQLVLEKVGSAQNLQLSRLWNARRCLLVEGKDFRLLCDFYDILHPQDKDGLANVPNMSIGGWGGWQYAVGSSMLLRNAGDERIVVYCLLDSDYHTSGQIQQRKRQAEQNGVRLHVWSVKEIENNLLVPSAIARTIASRISNGVTPPTAEDVALMLDGFAQETRDEVFDNFSSELLSEDRARGPAHANREARRLIDQAWETPEGRLRLVSGKALLSQLSQWAQESFGVSLTASAIIRAMTPAEVPLEVRQFIRSVADATPLRGP